MTVQDVMDIYEFKVVRKLLMDRYPFIVDVEPTSDEDIERYHSILFLNAFIDANKLQEYFKTPLRMGTFRRLKEHEQDYNPYLPLLLQSSSVDNSPPAKVQKDIDILLNKIHRSPAIPNDMKLQRKTFAVSTYVLSPEHNPNPLMWEGGQLVDKSPD